MATALPAATDFTGASITEAQFKTAITSMRTYLADLLGTDGVEGTALAAIMAPFSAVNPQTGSYALVASDRGKVIRYSGSGGVTLTLPVTSTTDFGIGYMCAVKNQSTGTITISRSGSDAIDGATQITLSPGEGIVLCIVMASVWISIGKGPGAATESASGTVELATTGEAIAGTDTDRAVTPAGALEVRKVSNYSAATNASSISTITVTGIPAWATRVTAAWANITRSAGADVYIELGDSGGIETGGPVIDNLNFSDGGIATFVNVTGNSWAFSAPVVDGTDALDTATVMSGTKTLSATLTQLRIRASTGSFTAGTLKVYWE